MGDIKLTLLGHFYNEEYLLPEWVNYHKQIFDRAILYDYDSTDRSVEIIKTLAPHWEVRKSKNKYFGAGTAAAIDQEIMEAEREHVGMNEWKICLNTTEFLFAKDVKAFLQSQPDDVNGIATHGVDIVDPPELEGAPLVLPALKTRHHGLTYDKWRCRLIHRYPDAQYKPGRHEFVPGHFGHTGVLPYISTEELLIVCLWYAPWNEEFIKRKLQVNEKRPAGETCSTRRQHDDQIKVWQEQSVDLKTFPPYYDIYKHKYEQD